MKAKVFKRNTEDPFLPKYPGTACSMRMIVNDLLTEFNLAVSIRNSYAASLESKHL